MWTAPRVNSQLKHTPLRYAVTVGLRCGVPYLDAAGAQAHAEPFPSSTSSAVAPFALIDIAFRIDEGLSDHSSQSKPWAVLVTQ